MGLLSKYSAAIVQADGWLLQGDRLASAAVAIKPDSHSSMEAG
jgi:hypothetical protein